MEVKKLAKKVWHFIWHDNSIWSWLVNILLAFLIVKFLLYPGLGLAMGTELPVVAVMSSSMEHNGEDFDSWWASHEYQYKQYNLTKENFSEYKFKNGFNKGDMIVSVSPKDAKVGDVIIFQGTLSYPIIHRIVEADGEVDTKGDNNAASRLDELDIKRDRILGKAVFRIPYVGYLKIWFMNLLGYEI